MGDEPVQRPGAEGDLFDRWLSHRDGESAPGGQLRASTVPPRWAPPVVAPTEPAPVVGPEAVVPAVAEPVAEPQAEPVPEPEPEPEPVVEDPSPTLTLDPADVRDPAAETSQTTPTAPPTAPPAAPPAPQEQPRQPTTAPAATTAIGDPPVRLTFRPRTRARTAVGIGTVLAAAAGVIGCFVAAREKDAPSVGIAVTLWVLTGIIWAVHSGTSVTRMSVRGGQLQVVQHGLRTTIDLTSSYTPVEVHGRPGKHGWKVIFRRRDMSPFVIDQSMVDAAEFMRVLRYYRPGVEAEQS